MLFKRKWNYSQSGAIQTVSDPEPRAVTYTFPVFNAASSPPGSERPIKIFSLLADADMTLPIITDYRPVPIYYRYNCNWQIHLESANIK